MSTQEPIDKSKLTPQELEAYKGAIQALLEAKNALDVARAEASDAIAGKDPQQLEGAKNSFASTLEEVERVTQRARQTIEKLREATSAREHAKP